uniref:EGF-like domain-containing protein n=1 Tax=Eptatretus burgeri TaxID=7764 RepID=A0A8C4NCC4_EPTBU
MVHRGVSLRLFSLFLCFVLFAAMEVVQTCSSNPCPPLANCNMNQQKSAYWCECPVGYKLANGNCISGKWNCVSGILLFMRCW